MSTCIIYSVMILFFAVNDHSDQKPPVDGTQQAVTVQVEPFKR